MDCRATESGESRYERRGRTTLRLPVQCRAQYIFNDVGRVATSRDLCADGIFLPTPKPLANGTLVDLCLTLDRRRPAVQVAARVVRATSNGDQAGMALAFTGRRLEAARGEVAAFLLDCLEQNKQGDPPEVATEAALARQHFLLQARERELDNRARTMDRVLRAVQTERQRLVELEVELERRQAAITHREVCLNRLGEALAEKEALLAHGQGVSVGVGAELEEPTRPDL